MSASKDGRNNRMKLNIKQRLKVYLIAIVKEVENEECLCSQWCNTSYLRSEKLKYWRKAMLWGWQLGKVHVVSYWIHKVPGFGSIKKAALVQKSVNDDSPAGINIQTRGTFFQKAGFVDLGIPEKGRRRKIDT